MNTSFRYTSLRDGEVLLMIVLSTYYCLPIVFTNVPFYLALAIFLTYGFFSSFTNKKKLWFTLCNGVFLLGLAVLLWLLGDVDEAPEFVSKLWSFVTCFFPVHLLYRYSRIPNRYTQRRVLVSCGLMYLVTMILTNIEMFVNPKTMREFEGQTANYERNIGHFDFAYANVIVVFVAWILYQYYREKKSGWRFFWLPAFLVTLVFQIRTQYTLAFVMVALVLFYFYILNKGKQNGSVKTYLIAFMVMLFLLPVILEILVAIIPYENITERLNEIIDFLYAGAELGYNAGGRWNFYMQAWDAFTTGFFTGNRELTFNSHSSYLSTIAHTGIWGLLLLILIMVRMYKQVVRILKINEADILAYKPAYALILFMGATNPLFSSYMFNFMGFFFVPALLLYLTKTEKQEQVDGRSIQNEGM